MSLLPVEGREEPIAPHGCAGSFIPFCTAPSCSELLLHGSGQLPDENKQGWTAIWCQQAASSDPARRGEGISSDPKGPGGTPGSPQLPDGPTDPSPCPAAPFGTPLTHQRGASLPATSRHRAPWTGLSQNLSQQAPLGPSGNISALASTTGTLPR